MRMNVIILLKDAQVVIIEVRTFIYVSSFVSIYLLWVNETCTFKTEVSKGTLIFQIVNKPMFIFDMA